MHSIVDCSGDVVGERDRLFPVSQGELYLIFVRMQKLKIAESLNSESQGDGRGGGGGGEAPPFSRVH